jgi:hypothetical protein
VSPRPNVVDGTSRTFATNFDGGDRKCHCFCVLSNVIQRLKWLAADVLSIIYKKNYLMLFGHQFTL